MKLLLLAFLVPAAAFQPQRTSFATFGNAPTKELIRQWQPRPLPVADGDAMLPSSSENMKRFVRARIMLESDENCGCVASFENALCVILTRFNGARHELLLPLWHPDVEPSKTFKDLADWHKECFSEVQHPPVLSGSNLEFDRDAWEGMGI